METASCSLRQLLPSQRANAKRTYAPLSARAEPRSEKGVCAEFCSLAVGVQCQGSDCLSRLVGNF